MRVGSMEVVVILLVAFILFGTNKVSGLGKALGTSIREFKEELHRDDPQADVPHEKSTEG